MMHMSHIIICSFEIGNMSWRIAKYKCHCSESDQSSWSINNSGQQTLAIVNPFHIDGCNSYAITTVSSADKDPTDDWPNNSNFFMMVLSAKSSRSLGVIAKSISNWLESIKNKQLNTVDIYYTLIEHDKVFNKRLIVDTFSLINILRALSKLSMGLDRRSTSLCSKEVCLFFSKAAFVFCGQCTEWPGMAGDLLQNKKIAQMLKAVDTIAKRFGHETSLLAYLDPKTNAAECDFEVTFATIQLSIFALQYSVANFLMKEAGIIPQFICGQSLGDITAACIANVISLEEAVKIIKIRAVLHDRSPSTGAMIAVGKQIFSM